ncbi:MAG: response regulator [Kofleriaceae bacterium]
MPGIGIWPIQITVKGWKRWVPIAGLLALTVIVACTQRFANDSPELILLVLPILLCAYREGFALGVVATVIGEGTAFAMDPDYDCWQDILQWFALIIAGVLVSALCQSMRSAKARAEAAAREAKESEGRFSASFFQSPLPLTLTNLATNRYTEVNAAFVKLSGRPREELLGASVTELGIFPDQTRMSRRLQRTGIVRNDPTKLRRKDGDLRDVVLSLDMLFIGSEPHSLTTLIDITDKLKTEAALRTSEDQLRQTQKMDSLGMLAGGIAHDFNNLLAVIATNASVLGEIVTDDEGKSLVEDIETTVTRAAGLTRQLLAFSRKQVAAPVSLDLNATISDTHKMLRRMIGEDVRLVTSYEPDLPHVMIDPGLVVQVVMNLAVNARDAMPRGGKLSISTRATNSSVILMVSDTGTGMPADVRARIFEPFFTTKGVGKGTGMGLSVVHGIVQQAHGAIEVTSAPGEGTTFQIKFPAVPETGNTIEIPVLEASRGHETILVVDDDDFVRKAATRALSARGYKVLEASNGQAALRALDRQRVDLVLTDVVMPNMDGRELAELATAAHPHLAIIYMSGYTDDAVIHHGVSRGEVDFVEKPFRVNTLAGKVRSVLDHKRPRAMAS